MANATRERLLTQIFGALSEADRATLLRLLDSLDEAGAAADRGTGRVGRTGLVDGAGGPGMTTRTNHDFSPGGIARHVIRNPCRGRPASRGQTTIAGSILVIVAIAQLMVVLDATVVNIALPSAQHALGFPNSDRQWVVTAYALAFGSLLLLGGRLGDMFSRKWVFITGLVGFARRPRR